MAALARAFLKAPLFQLLSTYGYTHLAPETSRSYDVGIEKGDRDSRAHAAVTSFHRDTRNLIYLVSS